PRPGRRPSLRPVRVASSCSPLPRPRWPLQSAPTLLTMESGGASEVCMEVRNLWRVFGQGPERAIDALAAGRDKAEVLAETGCNVGVRDVSFDVRRGETFVVMGLSGSGKSTLLRCVARLTDVTKGQVFLDGEEL